MNFKSLVIGVMVTALSVCGVGVRAGVEEEHEHLLSAIESVGVTVLFNTWECKDRDRDIDGLYNSRLGKLVICQDNAKWSTDYRIGMTLNDYDTLRHEAHHVIQDCVSGEIGDGLLGDLFKDPDDYNEFVSSTIGESGAAQVATSYGAAGADRLTILLEVEAFAMASSVPASVIGDTMRKICAK